MHNKCECCHIGHKTTQKHDADKKAGKGGNFLNDTESYDRAICISAICLVDLFPVEIRSHL